MSMPWRQRALLRPSELAEVSGRSLRTIRRKIDSGEIESRLEDGRRLIPIRVALAFVGEDDENAPEVCASGPVSRRASSFVARIRREAG